MRVLLGILLLVPAWLHADDFLDPDLAFRASAAAAGNGTLELRFEVAKGYYLYRDKFRFATPDSAVRLGAPRFPPGRVKDDEFFGKEEVYVDGIVVQLPLERASAEPATLALDVVLQGCAEAGFCYPPQSRTLTVALPAASPASTQSVAAQPATGVAQPVAGAGANTAAARVAVGLPEQATLASLAPPTGDESGRIAAALGHSGFVGSLLFFFVAGLGLALTPCVFPMIPILSGIIVGQRGPVSRARGFSLSAAYVGGMALTYSLAGVAAGLTGTLISAALQNRWALGTFAAIFVALAFSMFGFYDLQLPSALQTRLSSGAGRMRGGSTVGVFVMGALSALIVGPCVAAPLAGALLYIGQSGDAVLGGFALFVMALGMGVPLLLLVGLSAGTLLPRCGGWMEQVKKVFGVVLLATALQLVAPVLPAAVLMLGWAALLIIPAIFLHALDPLPPGAGGWTRFAKGCGFVMLITGATLLIGVLGGSRDPLQPLAGIGIARAQAETVATPEFERVYSLADLESKVKASPRPVLLDFYADWCASCKEMEHRTFADPVVRERLADFRLLKADVSANSAADQALLKRFGLYGPPGVLFFADGGNELAHKRLVGFQEPDRFLRSIASLN